MQQGDPHYGGEGESRLRRIGVGGEGGMGNAGDEAGGDAGYAVFGAGNEGPVADGASSMNAGDEQTWSMLAHLSVLLSLISGIGGVVAALVIWLVYRDRSDRVAFHALQSLWYQVAWSVLITAYATVSLILAVVVIGFVMLLFVPVIALIPLVHQCYAAYKVNQGIDYRYPVIANMVDRDRRFD